MFFKSSNPNILDRFNRAMPILGLPFFFHQARRAVLDGRREDAAFAQMMNELETSFDDRLKDQSERLEWFVVWAVGTSNLVVLGMSMYLGFGRVEHEFLFAGSTIVTIGADLAVGQCAARAFTLLEDRKGSKA